MEWNLPLLQDNFAQIDIDRIVTIPLSFYQSQDRLIWHHNTTGVYTVKTGFHLANSISEKNRESSSDDFKSWNKVLHGGSQRDPSSLVAYAISYLEKYRSAKVNSCNNNTHQQQSSIAPELSQNHSAPHPGISHQQRQHFGNVNSHNPCRMDGHRHAQSLDTQTRAAHHVNQNENHSSWQAANQHPHPSTSINNQYGNSSTTVAGNNWRLTDEIVWMPPEGNVLKMNIDAATNVQDKKLGIGAVVCNYKGEVIVAFSKPAQGCFRSDEMEAKALFHSLNWATQHQLSIAHVKTDAQRVSNALNPSHRNLSCFTDLIDDVCCILSFFLGVTVTHARRQANQAAHGLAKYALELDEDVS
uniref:RNase H type-1 domain-containing protein n=1 Tax=Cannabis sativa TaxID=3483 RepID=A0A803PNX4_CANSA